MWFSLRGQVGCVQRDLIPRLKSGDVEFEFDFESGDDVGVAIVMSLLKQNGN